MRNREEAAGAKGWSRANLAMPKGPTRNGRTVADRNKRDVAKAAAAGTNRPKWKEGKKEGAALQKERSEEKSGAERPKTNNPWTA